MKEALLYKKTDNSRVQCELCSHQCQLNEGQTGICNVRKNLKGTLYSLNYDKVTAIHSDPIEKKPLYHFLPASQSFSVAAMGCNFKCKFCQNHSISMVPDEHHIMGEAISPQQLIDTAWRYNSESISYTYTEPTIYFELMFETAVLAKERGIKNVMVTNGFMSRQALDKIAPYMDGVNVDLKAFTEEFYRKYSGARLAPVLETITAMKDKNIWIELTTLVIPGLNSNMKEIKDLIQFIVRLDPDIPWHVSRFFPQYQLTNHDVTPVETMDEILETAREMGLKYLYGGNISSNRWSHTQCPNCQTTLIKRSGYHSQVTGIQSGSCKKCREPIAGIWE